MTPLKFWCSLPLAALVVFGLWEFVSQVQSNASARSESRLDEREVICLQVIERNDVCDWMRENDLLKSFDTRHLIPRNLLCNEEG